MQSEESMGAARSALKDAGEPFRSAVEATVQQVRRLMEEYEDSKADVVEYNRAELGAFAADKIDIEKFTSVLTETNVIPATMVEVVEESLTVLSVASQMIEDVLEVHVDTHSSVTEAVRDALKRLGLTFGAARVVDLARHGQHDDSKHHALLDGVRFAMWTKAERLLAPPILLDVDGEDFHAGSMAEFLDGKVKLVVIPREQCAPAPLVRLIAPRTYVLQTRNPKDLEAFAAFDGPGIAMLGEGIARFVHDPSAGNSLAARLKVESIPGNPKKSLGGLSIRQQLEELEQLRSLDAAAPTLATPGENGDHAGTAALPADPADKLAAWLLSQARDLS